jgi:acylphosphatase
MSETARRVRAVVRGRVQQVGFRFFVVRHADRLGLNGTVANRPDGAVECVVEGPRGAVDELVRLLHDGPPVARVEQVDIREEDAAGSLPPMRING